MSFPWECISYFKAELPGKQVPPPSLPLLSCSLVLLTPTRGWCSPKCWSVYQCHVHGLPASTVHEQLSHCLCYSNTPGEPWHGPSGFQPGQSFLFLFFPVSEPCPWHLRDMFYLFLMFCGFTFWKVGATIIFCLHYCCRQFLQTVPTSVLCVMRGSMCSESMVEPALRCVTPQADLSSTLFSVPSHCNLFFLGLIFVERFVYLWPICFSIWLVSSMGVGTCLSGPQPYSWHLAQGPQHDVIIDAVQDLPAAS